MSRKQKNTKRIEWNEIGSVMTPAFRQLVILGTLFSLAMHTLSAFPREMLCALTLQAIL